MAGKGSEVVETQCLSAVQGLTVAWARCFPEHHPENSLSNCRVRISLSGLCTHLSLSYCIQSPRGNFIDINWSSVLYGSESRNSVLKLPESVHTKKSQPAAALYKSLVETGRFLFWFSVDQPLSTRSGVPTSLHAPPGNILSCSNCVQHGNWWDYVTRKFPAEAPVPLTYDKVSPATCLCCGSSEPWSVKQLIFLIKV